jgi:hypothetical protein
MSRRVSRRATAAAAAAVTVVGGGAAAVGVFGADGAVPTTGALTVRSGAARPQHPFVRGNGLYADGHRQELGGSVSGALMGPLSPVAVNAPSGGFVVYNTWRELRAVDSDKSFSKQGIADGDALGLPSLRVHDDKGRDSVLARGAYSVAVRPDGAIAYVQGVDPSFRAGRVYQGHVVVRRGVGGRPVEWTSEPARYVVYGWAGNRVLFYRIGAGERLEILVADAPGNTRPLADGSIVALNPGGDRVMVLSPDATSVRVLDVATGREQAWLDVTTAATPLRWLGYAGSWVGDHVVTPSSSGMVVLHVTAESIELEQALSLDAQQFPVGVQEPRFADSDADEILATADVPPDNAREGVAYFLDCDRVSRTCERGDGAPAKDWPRFIDNPSRPEGGR